VIRKILLTKLALTLFATIATGTAWADSQKCGGADIANGPFSYIALGTIATTFNGAGGSAVTTSFTVTAPSPSPDDSSVPNVFAGQGQNACLGQADASILALEVQKVGDANGNPIDPTPVDPNSVLGAQIVGAFTLSPSTHTFTPGDSLSVNVTVNNPNVSSTDYGDYDVKLAAQAPGAGIGVGNGLHFTLSLRAPSWTDTTPPSVTISKPASDQILGVIDVEVQEMDPVGSHNEGTGIASMSASIVSAGGSVNQSIPLTFTPVLPVAAGVTVTGTGTFTPFGGTGPAGTTDALAFAQGAFSGIGTYTINAQATDPAGNTGKASKTFNVNYDISFTKQFSTNPCQTGGGSSCTGQFEFTVNRSNITSDGAFMFDHTVVVQLKRVSDGGVVGTHVYGTGSILNDVQIDTALLYKTNFRRGNLIGAPTIPAAYYAEIYFRNVDGTLTKQATSAQITF
jgi:hypothetical protein